MKLEAVMTGVTASLFVRFAAAASLTLYAALITVLER
jgi:hypothetical protein